MHLHTCVQGKHGSDQSAVGASGFRGGFRRYILARSCSEAREAVLRRTEAVRQMQRAISTTLRSLSNMKWKCAFRIVSVIRLSVSLSVSGEGGGLLLPCAPLCSLSREASPWPFFAHIFPQRLFLLLSSRSFSLSWQRRRRSQKREGEGSDGSATGATAAFAAAAHAFYSRAKGSLPLSQSQNARTAKGAASDRPLASAAPPSNKWLRNARSWLSDSRGREWPTSRLSPRNFAGLHRYITA